ncbi:MAG: OmpA family protein, partial [Planctomycetaceae bacterium]|nr:OmpA family protein [Planctomycetaceae bacterium]
DAKSIEGGIICFQANSDELSEDAKRQLNLLIEDIDGLPFKIQITGHAEANEQGTYRDSIDLSYSRAVNVCRYFVSKGMNQNDFRIYAAGFSEPVEAEGIDLRKINTCVDIKIIANAVRNNEQKEQNKTGKELKYLKF